jgi:phosphoribosylamine--glycine ligase
VTTVVASAGYPDAPRTGVPISLPEFGEAVRVYHAGTKRDGRDLLTSGGRVFAVTAMADSVAAAQQASRDAASRIEFEGAMYRRDIGWREAKRVG